MGSLILQTAARYLTPLLILVSLIVFYRGHNHPGGGFIGGLIASSGFILYYFAFDIEMALRKYRFEPLRYITAGLILVLASGIYPMLSSKQFLTGEWLKLKLPLLGEIHLGTPTVFDLGIYLLVIGIVNLIISNLSKE